MLYQQGDILIESVDEIPADAVRLTPEEHRNTLAKGEVTGHAHRVQGIVDMFMQANTPTHGSLFMAAPRRIELTHEEHESINLPAGNYKISRVREYDYLTQEARVVRD